MSKGVMYAGSAPLVAAPIVTPSKSAKSVRFDGPPTCDLQPMTVVTAVTATPTVVGAWGVKYALEQKALVQQVQGAFRDGASTVLHVTDVVLDGDGDGDGFAATVLLDVMGDDDFGVDGTLVLQRYGFTVDTSSGEVAAVSVNLTDAVEHPVY